MEATEGAVTSPPSRSQLHLQGWQANSLEAGKFFPANQARQRDLFAPNDEFNAQPPADGQIASAGKNFAASATISENSASVADGTTAVLPGGAFTAPPG